MHEKTEKILYDAPVRATLKYTGDTRKKSGILHINGGANVESPRRVHEHVPGFGQEYS